MRRWVLFAFMALCTTGCVTQSTSEADFKAVRPGITREEFKALVTKTPASTLEIARDNRTYSVEVYALKVGTQTVTVMRDVWTTHRTYSVPAKKTVPILSDYVFVFEDSRLILAGFLRDLENADDELARQLAAAISAERGSK
jgi:hypothetical protein